MQLTLMKSTSSQDLMTTLSRYICVVGGERKGEGGDRGGGGERE